MGLKHFDNTWYCEKCGKGFKDKFVYCPCCGSLLKNEWFEMGMQAILNANTISVCRHCDREFESEYNFCPLCSNRLEKEPLMGTVKKDNSIMACWNGEEICVFDRDIFLSSPHFSASTVIDCLTLKGFLDCTLEHDFKEIGKEPPEKLSFEEACSILGMKGDGVMVNGFKFLPHPGENETDSHVLVLKIREDLYVKLNVVIVEY